MSYEPVNQPAAAAPAAELEWSWMRVGGHIRWFAPAPTEQNPKRCVVVEHTPATGLWRARFMRRPGTSTLPINGATRRTATAARQWAEENA